MLLEHVPCDLCASKEYKVRYRKPDNWLRETLFEFPVVECLHCGLVYENPRPALESMGAFYPIDYHVGRDGENFVRRYSVQKVLLPNISGKRVLDIGCARGDFLTYLLNTGIAFKPYGVDAFSTGVVDNRINFEKGLFTAIGYESDYFDLVMSWAVFEHLHRPTEYFFRSCESFKAAGSPYYFGNKLREYIRPIRFCRGCPKTHLPLLERNTPSIWSKSWFDDQIGRLS